MTEAATRDTSEAMTMLDDALSAAVEARLPTPYYDRVRDGFRAARSALGSNQAELLALRADIEHWREYADEDAASRGQTWIDRIDVTLAEMPEPTPVYACFAGGGNDYETVPTWQAARAWAVKQLHGAEADDAQLPGEIRAILASLEDAGEWCEGRWDWEGQLGHLTVIEIVAASRPVEKRSDEQQ